MAQNTRSADDRAMQRPGSDVAGAKSLAHTALAHTALLLMDLQNDFLHPDGAYGRAGQIAAAVSAVVPRMAPLVTLARMKNIPVIASQFTLVPRSGSEPLISPHLRHLRPFLKRGDFEPGAWGHAIVDELGAPDFSVEKIAYSAFYMTRLEWILRKLEIRHVIASGIVTNGGVASTIRDAHVRDLDITLLEDGCAAFSEDVHRTAIDSLRPVARIATIAELSAELNGA